MYISQDVKKC